MSDITVIIEGHVGKPAEVRQTKSGQAITGFSLAATPRFKKDGEWQDGETVWFSVSYWGHLPEVLLDKGANVQVIGTLSQRTWEANGKTGVSFDVRAQSVSSVIRTVNPAHTTPNNATPMSAIIDDLPF
jgi:single-strand DNA-binding protein